MGDAPKWKRKAQEAVADVEEGSSFKLTAGKHTFRVAPNKKGTKRPPYVELLMHYQVGPKTRSVRCGKDAKTMEGDCWLCDTQAAPLLESSKASKRRAGKELAPKRAIIMQVFKWDRETDSFRPAKPYWPSFGGPKTIGVQLLGLISSDRRSYDDPIKGYNLTVKRTGEGIGTTYSPIVTDEEPTKVPSKLLGTIQPFSAITPEYDEELQRAAFFGREVEESRKSGDYDDYMASKSKKKADEDDDEDNAAEIKKLKKKIKGLDEDDDKAEIKKLKKKLAALEGDDEDEDDDDDEDEDDDESKADKIKALKKKIKGLDEDDDKAKIKKLKKELAALEDDDDEDEDSDDDDDDEDEKPKKGKGKKSKDDDDDEDEEEDEDEDEEEDEDDDEDEKPKKGGKKKPAKKKGKK